MSEPEIGQQILHYRVVSKLGEGGMGAVYMAEDTKLHRKVALKFLPAEMTADPDRLKRFEREAQTVAALNHPNIVTIYSVDEHEGVPFIVMELVDGRSLAELIPKEGLKLEGIFNLAIPIADAVSAAHERGISHRDLKPGNIMVGSDGRVKVLDFGLAKLYQESEAKESSTLATQTLTKTGHALGTVTYMAPEQLKGRSPDQRADIFSLGIVLYQMASGSRPFQGETSAEIISSILRDAPPPVTDLKIELPSHLGRIVKRCLEKNPSHRYQTAAELRNELEVLKREIDSGSVFEEDAKTRAIRVQEASRRTFGLAAVLGAIAVVVVLAAVLIWMLGQDRSPPDPTFSQTPDLETIAVLPFATAGEDGDPAFSDGLSEELSSLLTALPALQVVSHATARQRFLPSATTQEMGEALGADYLVLGSVRWGDAGADVPTARTSLQVVRVADDIQIWSESYDRPVADELAVQTEIAHQAVRAVGGSVFGLPDRQLPPKPAIAQPEVVAEATPTPGRPPPKRTPPPATEPTPVTPPPATESSPSRVTSIVETPVPKPAESGAPAPVMLEIELTTFAPEGVLTLYADDEQILNESFSFEGRRKGILGRRKAAGSLSARQQIPAETQVLRVYLVVGNETRLVTLEPQLDGALSRRLEVLLNRKGELEATLQ